MLHREWFFRLSYHSGVDLIKGTKWIGRHDQAAKEPMVVEIGWRHHVPYHGTVVSDEGLTAVHLSRASLVGWEVCIVSLVAGWDGGHLSSLTMRKLTVKSLFWGSFSLHTAHSLPWRDVSQVENQLQSHFPTVCPYLLKRQEIHCTWSKSYLSPKGYRESYSSSP
jgi:hypothetical protein